MDVTSNPFKYGSIVEDDFFTDRAVDLAYAIQIIESSNHLILISPRRYGKTSLIYKAVAVLNRPTISINLQLVTSSSDLAAKLLKRVLMAYPFEKIKQFIKNFRIAPTISLNPQLNTFDVSFSPTSTAKPILEDD